jgi:hypothetical protein
MSQEERTGKRDLTYSKWHRRMSTRRFVGIEDAQLLAMIDLDASLFVEYDDGTKEPLALCEIARDTGQSHKTATVTTKLAMRTRDPVVPAYLILYMVGRNANPAYPEEFDIERFRVKRLWPNPYNEWRIATPEKWCKFLLRLRRISADKLDAIESQYLSNWSAPNTPRVPVQPVLW